MSDTPDLNFFQRCKLLFIGRSRDLHDRGLFHSLSLTAFFAWVALGSDGLSSSCYGPAEAFLALEGHTSLSIILALVTAAAIFLIAASYTQIIELFPGGGGGYLVASKLISPSAGMISGSALVVDYVLTVTISIASGADALFSFLPESIHYLKLEFAAIGIVGLIILNMRGIKESVVPLVPVFLIFLATHLFLIVLTLTHLIPEFGQVASSTADDFNSLHSSIGSWGILFLLMKAFSVGAGTFTGIEAVSNGVGLLREPRVETARRTMFLIALSLSVIVLGLVLGYKYYNVHEVAGKTLNAVLFETATASWPAWIASAFVLVALLSEAFLLLIAAETGMLDGPRVMASMALDRWLPSRFAYLSDRFVSQNGILFMGIAALGMLFISGGDVGFLVVLYSINVFLTFTLSQWGMVSHWMTKAGRATKGWASKFLINGVGLILCGSILIAVIAIKFSEGAWLTFVITGALVALGFWIKHHYRTTAKMLKRLDILVSAVSEETERLRKEPHVSFDEVDFDPKGKTAVMAVSGFNGLGLHTLLNIRKVFGDTFRNFVFIHVGVIDAGNFKGESEMQHLKDTTSLEVEPYVDYIRSQGYFATGVQMLGNDIVEAVAELAPDLFDRYPNAVFFGGQVVFPDDTFVDRWLHNYVVFALQRRLYSKAIPFVIIPVRV